MQLEPECIPCILQQVLKALKQLKPDISREEIIKAQKEVMNYLISVDPNESASHLMGKKAYGVISDFLKDPDPYRELKKQFNDSALKYYDKVKKIVDNAEDPPFEALIVSALGNTFDPAAQHEIDFIGDLQDFKPENLKVNDYDEFKRNLDSAEHLLILGDNVGEIVFDKILIITLKRYHPDIEIVYSVRGGPIINDSTMEDAAHVGITELVHVIESTATPGIDFPSSSEEFKEYFFKQNGVILSKGQGNFESLYRTNIPETTIFYLLKAKCSLMERIFGVKLGDLIFKKKTLEF